MVYRIFGFSNFTLPFSGLLKYTLIKRKSQWLWMFAQLGKHFEANGWYAHCRVFALNSGWDSVCFPFTPISNSQGSQKVRINSSAQPGGRSTKVNLWNLSDYWPWLMMTNHCNYAFMRTCQWSSVAPSCCKHVNQSTQIWRKTQWFLQNQLLKRQY